MPVFNNALAGAAGSGGAAGYEIKRSLRFNDDDSAKLTRTFSSAGNQKKWTWSGWVKRSSLGVKHHLFAIHTADNDSGYFRLAFQTDSRIFVGLWSKSVLTTDAVFRDFSAWMHIVLVLDLENSTAADKIILYVNGVRQSVTLNVGTDQSYAINSAGLHNIGSQTNTSQHFDGYLADVHFVDGQALAPTDFGEFDADTGVWNPIEYTGSHTTAASATGTLTNYNNNTTLPTYSDQDNNSGTPSVYQMENAFDGNSSTYANMTYANGKWTRANFAQPITNVTRIDVGWDGEGDVGYNGSVVNSSVGYTGGRQSLTLYNNSGSPITLNNIHMVSQAGNGVCRLYDVTITTTTQSATELTFSSVPAGPNGFHLDFSDNSSNAALGTDNSGNNNTWTVNYFSTQDAADYSTGTFTVQSGGSMLTVDQAFNGSTSNGAIQNGIVSGTNEHTWTPSSPITGVTSLRIYMRRSDASGGDSNFQYKINTGSYVNSGIAQNGSGWVTPSSVPSTLSSISLKSIISNNSNGLGINAIEVNGTILTNNDGSGNDSLLDSPTNYEADSGNNGGNYATLNPLATNNVVYENGNLHARKGPGTGWSVAVSNFGMTTGKWYCEITNKAGTTHQIGIVKLDEAVLTGGNVPIVDYTWGWGFINDGTRLRLRSDLFGGGNATDTLFGATGSNFVANDIIGLAYDADNQEFSIYKNGTLVGNTTSSWTNAPTPGTYAFAISLNSSNAAVDFNFGQRPFSISSIPTGYKSLCTQNLTTPAIVNGSTAFDITTFNNSAQTSGSFTTTITPDMIIMKRRDATSNWVLQDIVRGYGDNKNLHPNLTTGETSTDNITGVNDKTVSYGTNSNMYNSQVAWYWDAGTSNTSISAGGLNSSLYNQSQTWSNSMSISGSWDSGGVSAANAFDGLMTTNARAMGQNMQITFDITSSPLTFTDKVELYHTSSGMDVSVNGGTVQVPATNQFVTIASGGGTLNRITFVNANAKTVVVALRVDGKLLVDPNAISTPSIASTYRANPSAGFSIVSTPSIDSTDTIRTAAHGLNATPEFIISKNRDFSDAWFVYHKDIQTDNKQRLYLNTTSGTNSSSATLWAHTSNVIGFNGAQYVASGNTDDLIFWAWAPVEGYSSFGLYTSNASTDGPFVYTGMRPKFIMIKAASTAGDMTYASWLVVDTKRDTYNVSDAGLFTNKSSLEGTRGNGTATAGTWLDILSNGFKIRYNGTEVNGVSGQTYIYAAFAENPFKTARAR